MCTLSTVYTIYVDLNPLNPVQMYSVTFGWAGFRNDVMTGNWNFVERVGGQDEVWYLGRHEPLLWRHEPPRFAWQTEPPLCRPSLRYAVNDRLHHTVQLLLNLVFMYVMKNVNNVKWEVSQLDEKYLSIIKNSA